MMRNMLLVAVVAALLPPSLLVGGTNDWPRQEGGHSVVKTFNFDAELVSVVARPTVVPDNLIIKFRILDDTVPANYFWVTYQRYREKDLRMESVLTNGVHAVYQLTVDAIAVNPPTDKSSRGSPEFRHDDGSLLSGEIKELVLKKDSPTKP
jgi:hypothetical protein